jgi:hypothetical protein
VGDYCLTLNVFQQYRDENKLHFDEMMILKLQSAGRHVFPLGRIIPIPKLPVVALTL